MFSFGSKESTPDSAMLVLIKPLGLAGVMMATGGTFSMETVMLTSASSVNAGLLSSVTRSVATKMMSGSPICIAGLKTCCGVALMSLVEKSKVPSPSKSHSKVTSVRAWSRWNDPLWSKVTVCPGAIVVGLAAGTAFGPC